MPEFPKQPKVGRVHIYIFTEICAWGIFSCNFCDVSSSIAVYQLHSTPSFAFDTSAVKPWYCLAPFVFSRWFENYNTCPIFHPLSVVLKMHILPTLTDELTIGCRTEGTCTLVVL